MIEHLSLTNFQSWRALDLPLTGVVVIVGETHQGKSAIIRALNVVLYNGLEGTSFVRQGEKVASVAITESSTTVTLEKGVGTNRYLVGAPGDTEPQVYDKIGRSVPEAVQRVLGVSEVRFDDDTTLTLQFQPQMDAPFLLADEGVKATRLLGSVSQVATLYQAARLSSTKKKGAMASMATLETVAEAAEGKAAGYVYLDQVAPVIAEIETTSQALDSTERQWDQLQQVWATLTAARQTEATLHTTETRLARRVALQHALVDNRTSAAGVRSAWDSLRQATATLTTLAQAEESRVSRREQAEVRVRRLDRLQMIQTERTALQRAQAQVQQATQAEIQQAEAVAQWSVTLVARRDRVQTIERQLTCPTCGRLGDRMQAQVSA